MSSSTSSEAELVAHALKLMGPPDPGAGSPDIQIGGAEAELAVRAMEALNTRLDRLRATAPSNGNAARELYTLLNQLLATHEAQRSWAREAAAPFGPTSPAGQLAARIEASIEAVRAELKSCEKLLT
jgi:hypothetical protein